MKVLDSSSLRDTMKEREQHYKELRKQFSQLRNDFQEIVELDDFEGKGAKAIKGFYQGQIEVVEAWQRLIDRQIAFFKGVSGKLDDKDLGGDTRVDTAFLEEGLAQKERQADEMITEQRRSLEHIFRDIDDLVPLEPYSRNQFDDLMMNANRMRTKTITSVEETDKELKDEYMSSEGEESYVIQLFGALISATSKGSSISPIHFDGDAYHTSDIYKQMDEAEAATLSFLTYKKEEQEARELENRPTVEKVWDGVKSFVGEFTGYYDYKRAVDGVDPVTGEKMSAIQRAASAGWAIAGFLPIVGWAGRAVKGGKGIYAAAKGISAADQAMSTYKNVHAFTSLEKTEMGIYGLLSANGLSEYVTGKDMLGNELTEQQRQASLAQSVFAGLPFVPSMAKASKLGHQAVNSTVQFGKQGADLTTSVIDDLGQKINIGPNVSFADGIGNLNSNLKAEFKVDVGKVSAEKEDYLSSSKSADDKGTSKASPSEIAQSWQGSFPYVGIDKYRNITLKKGKVIYVGEPYPTGYATTKSAVDRINGDSRKLFEGLQVKPYWEDGMDAAEYRSKMMAYELIEDTTVAFGITKANPQFGDGGLPQMFIPDFNELVKKGLITRLESSAIELNNYKMPLDDYYRMLDLLEELK